MSKKCELPDRQKNFWGAAALLCSFAGLIIMFHVCVYTGDNLIAYVAATTATLLISGVYGGMQGWTLAKRNFWDFYTTDPSGLKKLLDEFIEKHVPECAFPLDGQCQNTPLPLVGSYAVQRQTSTPDKVLRATCEDLMLQLIGGQVDALAKLEPLQVIARAAERVSTATENTNRSVAEATKERERLLLLTRAIANGQLPSNDREWRQLMSSEPECVARTKETVAAEIAELRELAARSESPSEKTESTAEKAGMPTDPKGLAVTLGLEFIDLSVVIPNEAVIKRISPGTAHWYQVLPVRMDEEILVVAMAEPSNAMTCAHLEQLLRQPVKGAVAEPRLVASLIEKYYGESPTIGEPAAPEPAYDYIKVASAEEENRD